MKLGGRSFPILALGVLAAGQGSEGGADSSGPTGPAVLKGTVRVVDPPRRRKIRMDAEPAAVAMHEGPVFRDDIVVDAENRVQWAFVSVKGAFEGKRVPAPQGAKLLVHEKCLVKPHVLGIQVGQPLRMRNEDGILHNYHGLTLANREFNFGQKDKGSEEVKVFFKPEGFFKIKCDIHPWEDSWVTVLPHPFYAVTGPDGRYEIHGLPPGEYTIEVWQELYKSVTRKLTARSGSRLTADFTLGERKTQD